MNEGPPLTVASTAVAEARRSPWRAAAVWWRTILGSLVLGVLAGLTWFALSPRVSGPLNPNTGDVIYPGHDDAGARVVVCYLAVCAVAGLLVGLIVLVRHLGSGATRIWVLCGSGLLGALLCYATGFLLGPDTVRAQAEAGQSTFQVPLELSSPLLALVWPAATAAILCIGNLLSLVLHPPAVESD